MNGIYGCMGMYTSLIYNVNVASSVTAQGRALVSTAIMFFEMFLANNVKFGSLNEVVTFFDNVINEKPYRKFKDHDLLDRNITPEECFAKVVMTCGFRWVPDEEEMDIIWKMINNMTQEDINRIYYKNNLYEFMNNSSMRKSLLYILKKLDKPYLNPLKCPEEIKVEMDTLSQILFEFVYYRYMIIDRMDRNEFMIKSICMISDTDSAIISLDGWYRYVLEQVQGIDFKILHESIDPLIFFETDEFGDITDDRWKRAITFEEPDLDFDFYNDEIIEMKKVINPIVELPQDNLRHTIINIMAYVLDYCVNDYLEQFSRQNHTYRGPGQCKLILKNEFLGVKNEWELIQGWKTCI